MQAQFDFDAEGVFEKPLRPRRKRKGREKWIALKLARAIRQTMHAPKLLKDAMPRVILKEKYLQQPRSPESEFGLKWQGPRKKPIERRVEQRRVKNWVCDCDGSCIWERRVLDRRSSSKESREKPDKYHYNPVTVDPIRHTAIVSTKHRLRRSAGGRGISGRDGTGEIIAGSYTGERARLRGLAAMKVKGFDKIGTS